MDAFWSHQNLFNVLGSRVEPHCCHCRAAKGSCNTQCVCFVVSGSQDCCVGISELWWPTRSENVIGCLSHPLLVLATSLFSPRSTQECSEGICKQKPPALAAILSVFSASWHGAILIRWQHRPLADGTVMTQGSASFGACRKRSANAIFLGCQRTLSHFQIVLVAVSVHGDHSVFIRSTVVEFELGIFWPTTITKFWGYHTGAYLQIGNAYAIYKY